MHLFINLSKASGRSVIDSDNEHLEPGLQFLVNVSRIGRDNLRYTPVLPAVAKKNRQLNYRSLLGNIALSGGGGA